MKIQWMIVLAFLVVIAGCDSAKKAENAAAYEAQNAKVKARIEKAKEEAKNISRPSMSPPGLLGKEDEKKDTKEDSDNDADDKGEADKGEDDKGTDQDKIETSLKLNAQSVLDEAIASAKANDKALFVHFTAAW